MSNVNIELEKKIKRNIIEKIAAYNVKEEFCNIKNSITNDDKNENEINSKSEKRLNNKRLIYSILSVCAVFILGVVFVNNNTNFKSMLLGVGENNNNEIVENSISVASGSDIDYVLNTVDKNKIIYKSSDSSVASCYAYEPNIENLYKNSSIVFVGSFIEDVESYNDAPLIHTKTKFSVSQVLKNETDISIDDTIVFDRMGGVMTLEEYMKDNPYIRDDEFANVPEDERDEYYVVQNEIPIDKKEKLDFSKKDAKYIVFLYEREGILELNTEYYGIRLLNSKNEIYDYDTDRYIENKVSRMIK